MEGVKSARRVLEFLEYFSEVQRAVSVAELAKHYHYPVSSVSTVMRTMVSMGYLSYDGRSRTYLPTTRIMSLVEWVGVQLFKSETARAIMQSLSDATGETILLAVQSGLRIHYLQVIDATGPVRLHVEAGSFREMAATAVGRMLMSQLDDAAAGKLIRRINNEQTDPEKLVDLKALLCDLARIRTNGYAVSIGGVVKHGGAIAVMLPKSFGPAPLAIGIGSVRSVLEANEQHFVDLLRAAVAEHATD
jgi:DNA-binding IclR family transcriptional regulator